MFLIFHCSEGGYSSLQSGLSNNQRLLVSAWGISVRAPALVQRFGLRQIQLLACALLCLAVAVPT
jgi:hypothetical protein